MEANTAHCLHSEAWKVGKVWAELLTSGLPRIDGTTGPKRWHHMAEITQLGSGLFAGGWDFSEWGTFDLGAPFSPPALPVCSHSQEMAQAGVNRQPSLLKREGRSLWPPQHSEFSHPLLTTPCAAHRADSDSVICECPVLSVMPGTCFIDVGWTHGWREGRAKERGRKERRRKEEWGTESGREVYIYIYIYIYTYI